MKEQVTVAELQQEVAAHIRQLQRQFESTHPGETLIANFDHNELVVPQEVKRTTLAFGSEVAGRGQATDETTSAWLRALLAADFLIFPGDKGGEAEA